MESTKTHKIDDLTNNGSGTPLESDIERSVEIGETENETLAVVRSEGEKQNAFIMDFPDGGAKAWSVAIGAAGILFCTFGYINAFGTSATSATTPLDSCLRLGSIIVVTNDN